MYNYMYFSYILLTYITSFFLHVEHRVSTNKYTLWEWYRKVVREIRQSGH